MYLSVYFPVTRAVEATVAIAVAVVVVVAVGAATVPIQRTTSASSEPVSGRLLLHPS